MFDDLYPKFMIFDMALNVSLEVEIAESLRLNVTNAILGQNQLSEISVFVAHRPNIAFI